MQHIITSWSLPHWRWLVAPTSYLAKTPHPATVLQSATVSSPFQSPQSVLYSCDFLPCHAPVLPTPLCRPLHITYVNSAVRLSSTEWQILTRESSKIWGMFSWDVIDFQALILSCSHAFKWNIWHFGWFTTWTYYLSISAFTFYCKLWALHFFLHCPSHLALPLAVRAPNRGLILSFSLP